MKMFGRRNWKKVFERLPDKIYRKNILLAAFSSCLGVRSDGPVAIMNPFFYFSQRKILGIFQKCVTRFSVLNLVR